MLGPGTGAVFREEIRARPRLLNRRVYWGVGLSDPVTLPRRPVTPFRSPPVEPDVLPVRPPVSPPVTPPVKLPPAVAPTFCTRPVTGLLGNVTGSLKP
ncbi:MAG: hypothetical protein EON93_09530, partial [Burkholderiales bacterium]